MVQDQGHEDEPMECFVTREGGDDLDLRDATGKVTTIQEAGDRQAGKREVSIMPEALVAKTRRRIGVVDCVFGDVEAN